MQTIINFTKPRNEATVKLYTSVSVKEFAYQTQTFFRRTPFGSSLPDAQRDIFDIVYFTLLFSFQFLFYSPDKACKAFLV